MPNSNQNRPGVILAAGLGSRLAAQGQDTSTKSLLNLSGVPLVIRTLRSLEIAGCLRVVVVLGHKAELVQAGIQAAYKGPIQLQFVTNPQYKLMNGISVLSAKPFLEDEFILSMADHVFDDGIMELVRDNHAPPNGATLCVDYKIDTIFDLDDVTKVVEQDGSIIEIGKHLERYNCADTGIFICTMALIDAIQQVYDAAGDASLSDGVQALASRRMMGTLDIGDRFWQDVDTPEMLAHAEEMLAQYQ